MFETPETKRRVIPVETFGEPKQPIVITITIPGVGTVSKSKVFAPQADVEAAIRKALESLAPLA